MPGLPWSQQADESGDIPTPTVGWALLHATACALLPATAWICRPARLRTACIWLWLLMVTTGVLADSPDRPVAHWAIELGGSIELEGDPQRYRSVVDLPLDDYQVRLVDLVGTNILPPDLERLAELKGLKRLILPGPMWNPSAGARTDYSEELKHLAGLTSLEELIFSGTYLESIKFQDDGLAKIKSLGPTLRKLSLEDTQVRGRHLSAFQRLESLDLVYCPIDDKGAEELKALTGLRELLLRDALITDAAAPCFSGLVQLERLDLGGTKLSDTAVQCLAPLAKLRKLNLQGTRLSDASASVLASLPALEELNLYGTRLSNVGLDALKQLKNLRWLDVRYTKVTRSGVEGLRDALPDCAIDFLDLTASSPVPDAAMRKIDLHNPQQVAEWVKALGGSSRLESGQLVAVSLAKTAVTDELLANLAAQSSLRELDLEATEISDLGLRHLQNLAQLQTLDLSFTSVSDSGVTTLPALSNLKRLELKGTQVTGETLDKLAGLSLEVLLLANCPITDAGLKAIAQVSTITELGLSYTDITDKGLPEIKRLEELAWLDLDGTDVGDNGSEHLGACPRLEHVLLSYTKISDKALRHLSKLQRLRNLTAVRTRITDKGLETLAGQTTLEGLDLDYTDVTATGIRHLSSLQKLQRLSLDSTNVADEAANELVKMQQLKYLNLYHTFITQAAFEKLRQALPACEIVFEAASADAKRRRS